MRSKDYIYVSDRTTIIMRSRLLAIGKGQPLSAYYYNYFAILLNLLNKLLYLKVPFTGAEAKAKAHDAARLIVTSTDTIDHREKLKSKEMAIVYKIQDVESTNVGVRV